MATPSDLLPKDDSAEAAKSPKSTWETVLTLTPVVLTVLGTLLAGLSSSEMTLAQYHRTLAGQSQSKAGDQWAFFQAKRIRGQSMEGSLDLFPALSRFAALTPEALNVAAGRLLLRLQQVEKSADRLQEAVGEANLGDSSPAIRQAVADLVKITGDQIRAVTQAQAALRQDLETSGVQAAFAFVGTGKLPEVADGSVHDPRIDALLKTVADRRPEHESAPLLLSLPEETLQQAIDASDANARRFEVASEPVSKALHTLDTRTAALVRSAAAVHRAVVAVEIALGALPEERTKALSDARSTAGELARSDDAVRAAAEELTNTVRMARLEYTARRYAREAADNQRIAGLYEVQVRKYGAAADRHRDRSKMFFYGMLLAQAGVAIASMSLAARQRSVLWGLAGLAGSMAVAFSLYVYLYR
jgi:hypothetical protein